MILNKIKTIKNIFTIAFAVILLSSCGDENNFERYTVAPPADNANVKFIHVGTGLAPINWFIDGEKVTSGAKVTSGLPLGVIYGGLLNGLYRGVYPTTANYASIKSGTKSMKIETAATTTVPVSTVLNAPITLEPRKYYTTFVTGNIPNYSVFTVNDDLSLINPNKANIRFFNMVSNAPAAGYDFSITELNAGANLFTSVPYLGGSASFTPIDVVADNVSATYSLKVKIAGTSTVVASVSYTTFRRGKIHTLFIYGLATAPVLSMVTNR